MNIKNLFLAALAMLAGTGLQAQKMMVNTSKSTVEWNGKKIGGEHTGFVKIKSGSLEMSGDKITSGSIIIDMNSITNTDLTDDTYNQKLVGHLKSDDFFGVAKYPTAKLEVTSASAFKNGKATVKAKLTIKGKTEPSSFEVKKSGDVYMTTLKVDRSKYDVRYGSNSFFDNLGDKVIEDIFALNIKLMLN